MTRLTCGFRDGTVICQINHVVHSLTDSIITIFATFFWVLAVRLDLS